MAKKLIDLYPVVIRQARYQGVYEDGKWIAFPECEEFTEQMEDYFFGDDSAAIELFTDEYKKKVGLGVSPDHAYADLCYKNGIPVDLLKDWYPL